MKPLRSAALVMLAIAVLDGILKLIEFVVGAELWRVMLATGLVLIAADYLLSQRGSLAAQLREFIRWVWRQAESALDRLLNRPPSRRKRTNRSSSYDDPIEPSASGSGNANHDSQ